MKIFAVVGLLLSVYSLHVEHQASLDPLYKVLCYLFV
jgi:hypothetical protein